MDTFFPLFLKTSDYFYLIFLTYHFFKKTGFGFEKNMICTQETRASSADC